MLTDKGQFWHEYFVQRHKLVHTVGVARSLDYPNDPLRFQIYAHLFEAAGALQGKDCLDVGCGWGACALMFSASGANVTGVDIVPDTISQLARLHPEVTWRVLDATSDADIAGLPSFDRIVASEVLQHVEFDLTVDALWKHVRPGGRLLGSIPNSECPIIQTVVERYEGHFAGASPSQIACLCAKLPDVRDFWLKGLAFRADQAFLPYYSSDWCKTVIGTPNRLIFVMLRGNGKTGV